MQSLPVSLKHTPYLAIELRDNLSSHDLQALSPKIMRWSDSLWLVDLEPCASYWEQRAASCQCSITVFLKNMLHDLYGEHTCAALATHPWPSILLLQEMRQRQLNGLLLAESPFGQTLLQDLSWSCWWSCTTNLAQYLTHIGRRRWNPVAFKRQCRDMQRAMQRLGFTSAGHLSSIPSSALARRFGATLAELRDWTYAPSHAASKSTSSDKMRPLFTDPMAFASGFPWQSLTHTQKPSVVRHLDVPLREWSHIAPYLKEDFDRLCLLGSWSRGERIVSLEWRLTLSDLSSLSLTLRFRHPHAMHSEQGAHPTALLQASYAFDQLQRTHKRYPCLRDGYQPIPSLFAIAGWQLCITERITIPRQSTSLFGDVSVVESTEAHAFHGQLSRLENKLLVPLTTFDLCVDWLPEDSFRDISPKAIPTPSKELDDLTVYAHRVATCAASKERPLFIYRKPHLVDQKILISARNFHERTMHKWWDQTSQHPTKKDKIMQRDYYRIRDDKKRSLWIYRDNIGQYFVHGIFS